MKPSSVLFVMALALLSTTVQAATWSDFLDDLLHPHRAPVLEKAQPVEIPKSQPLPAKPVKTQPVKVEPMPAAKPITPTPQPRPVEAEKPTPAPTPVGSIPACSNPNALPTSRIVEIDSDGSPGFGGDQFKAYNFLEDKEVILTFDDGPWPQNTQAVLDALAKHCQKAIFFNVGEHALWHPEITKAVLAAGHIVGSHTWSHVNLARFVKTPARGIEEFEKGYSAVKQAAGEDITPFFRFPALVTPKYMVDYLATRNVSIWSADIDSDDYKTTDPQKVISTVMTRLQKQGRGIILMHDFQKSEALAIGTLLVKLKEAGYKTVQVVNKQHVGSLPEWDKEIAARSKSPSTRKVRDPVTTIAK